MQLELVPGRSRQRSRVPCGALFLLFPGSTAGRASSEAGPEQLIGIWRGDESVVHEFTKG